jgi:hypothetical protein
MIRQIVVAIARRLWAIEQKGFIVYLGVMFAVFTLMGMGILGDMFVVPGGWEE